MYLQNYINTCLIMLIKLTKFNIKIKRVKDQITAVITTVIVVIDRHKHHKKYDAP